jgi:uncharacterized membrane protein YgdD (TMEM256/DUF423 family)
MSARIFLVAGALTGALGVALGAWGAHAWKEVLMQSGRWDTFELANRYQFYHTLALLLTGMLYKDNPNRYLQFSGLFFCIGMVLFSGSLYALCFSGVRSFAWVTPIGGLSFIAGWLFLLSGCITKKLP